MDMSVIRIFNSETSYGYVLKIKGEVALTRFDQTYEGC